MSRIVSLFIGCCGLGLMAIPLNAATFHVPAEQPTIQAGINVAQTGDTVLVASGTYSEAITFLSKSIVVMSESGAATTIIVSPAKNLARPRLPADLDSLGSPAAYAAYYAEAEAQAATPVVTIPPGSDGTTVLSGFTIDGGNATQGIFCDGSNPVIRECIIEHGQGFKDGGGLFFQNCGPEVRDNIIRYNATPVTGAGLFMRLGTTGSVARVIGNKIYGNQGGNGPAISLIEGSDAVVSRNIVYGNIVPTPGSYIRGVVYVRAANVAVVNNTINGNTRGLLALTVKNVDIRNNIISNNIEGGFELRDDDGPNVNVTWDYNDVWNNAGNNYLRLAGPAANDISADPLFEPTYPETYYLLGLSPCRDGGDPDPVYNDPDGSRNDIGAFYYQYLLGDANGDRKINIGDAVYIVNYVFRGGPEPLPLGAGDANCDGNVDTGDAVYLVNYIFRGGPAPACP